MVGQIFNIKNKKVIYLLVELVFTYNRETTSIGLLTV